MLEALKSPEKQRNFQEIRAHIPKSMGHTDC